MSECTTTLGLPGHASGTTLADGVGAADPAELAEEDSSQPGDSSSLDDEEPSTSGRVRLLRAARSAGSGVGGRACVRPAAAHIMRLSWGHRQQSFNQKMLLVSVSCSQDDAGVSGADSGPSHKGKRDEVWKAKRDEAWEARRRFNNLRRREKFAAKKKAKAAAARYVCLRVVQCLMQHRHTRLTRLPRAWTAW